MDSGFFFVQCEFHACLIYTTPCIKFALYLLDQILESLLEENIALLALSETILIYGLSSLSCFL